MARAFTEPTPNLFGEMQADPMPPPPVEGKRRKTVPRGYAAAPGTGPKGETCKTCVHKAVIKMGGRYLKCELCRDRWTHGPATDIKAGAPACAYWRGFVGTGYVLVRTIPGWKPLKVGVISATADVIETEHGTFKRTPQGTWMEYPGCTLEHVKLKEGAKA